MKIKIIELSHSSQSYSLGEGEKELKKLILNDWPARVAKQIKKFYPEMEVECWAPEKIYQEKTKFEDSGVLFRFFPTTFAIRYALDLSVPMIKELKREVKKSKREGYKLIIKIHEVHNLHGLLIATLFRNEKIICQHHGGSYPLKHLREKKEFKKIFPLFYISQIWENLVLKNIKIFYALSKEEEKYLKKRTKSSIIKFQTMGIEDEYFENISKKTARQKLKLEERKKILLYIGRVAEIKGMGFLLKAMKELNDIELKIIGFGPEEPRFKKYVMKNAIKNVEFLGGVFGGKKMLYLSASDALILPSLKEGAPVTVMEALAKNTPVIVTDVGGVPLMIKNGREGIIIKQKSPEEIVRGIREILKWKKKNVKKYAEKYRWKKIIRKTVEDYKKLG